MKILQDNACWIDLSLCSEWELEMNYEHDGIKETVARVSFQDGQSIFNRAVIFEVEDEFGEGVKGYGGAFLYDPNRRRK